MAELVYITKYALSEGVRVRRLQHPIAADGYARTIEPWSSFGFYGRCDYRSSWDEALADCEARRSAKIASLKKQIAKLEKLKFVEPTEVGS